MMMYHDMDLWRTIALSSAALGQTAFVLLYLSFPWWTSFLGRALFAKGCALVLIIDFAAFSRLFGFGHSDIWFTALYSALAFGVWWQFVAFLRVRLAGRQDRVSRNPVSADV